MSRIMKVTFGNLFEKKKKSTKIPPPCENILLKFLENGVLSKDCFVTLVHYFYGTNNYLNLFKLIIKKKYLDMDKILRILNLSLKTNYDVYEMMVLECKKEMERGDLVDLNVYKNSISSLMKICAYSRSKKYLKILIANFDPTCFNHYVLRKACIYGDLDIVKLVIKHEKTDPNACHCAPLISSFNKKDVFKFLLKHDKVKFDFGRNTILCSAWSAGKEVTELLLKKINPSLYRNRALRYFGMYCRNVESFKCLLSDPRVDPMDCDVEPFVQLMTRCFGELNPKLEENSIGIHLRKMEISDEQNRSYYYRSKAKLQPTVFSMCQEYLTHEKVNKIALAVIWINRNNSYKEYNGLLKEIAVKKDFDLSFRKNFFFRKACCKEDNYELIRLLLKNPSVNPGDKKNEALKNSIKNRCLGITKLLLSDSRVDAGARNNFAIRYCCRKRGFDEIVEILLKIDNVDPRDRNEEAFTSTNPKIVKMLNEWKDKKRE